jgi:hypothetical protein
MTLAGKRVLAAGGSRSLGRNIFELLSERTCGVFAPLLTHSTTPEPEALPVLQGSVDLHWPDVGKLEALKVYRPNVPLDVSLKDTFAWYRSEAGKSKARSPSLASY